MEIRVSVLSLEVIGQKDSMSMTTHVVFKMKSLSVRSKDSTVTDHLTDKLVYSNLWV